MCQRRHRRATCKSDQFRLARHRESLSLNYKQGLSCLIHNVAELWTLIIALWFVACWRLMTFWSRCMCTTQHTCCFQHAWTICHFLFGFSTSSPLLMHFLTERTGAGPFYLQHWGKYFQSDQEYFVNSSWLEKCMCIKAHLKVNYF